ncbi:hypothetical protein GCM10025298_31230 [Natronobiforma cellulositropha]
MISSILLRSFTRSVSYEITTNREWDESDPPLLSSSKAIPDGSLPSSAGITLTNSSHLQTFLHEYADAPGFEIMYKAVQTTNQTYRLERNGNSHG